MDEIVEEARLLVAPLGVLVTIGLTDRDYIRKRLARLDAVRALRPAAPHGSSPMLTDPHDGE